MTIRRREFLGAAGGLTLAAICEPSLSAQDSPALLLVNGKIRSEEHTSELQSH